MLNPILPNATGGGADPELEGRVDALEDQSTQIASEVTDLATQLSSVNVTLNDHANSISDLQDFKNANSVAIGGVFTTPYLYSMSSYWLTFDRPLSDFNTTLGTVEFSVNDATSSFTVEEGDTLNEISNKFSTAASSLGFYGFMQPFAGQIRILLYDGFKLSFPRVSPDYQHLWSVLGLAELSAQSVEVDAPHAIIANRVWMDSSTATVEDYFRNMQTEVDTIQNVITNLGGIETNLNPDILNVFYMYPDLFGINLLTEDTDLEQYGITAASTFDIKVDGQQYYIPAGTSLRVRDVIDQLNGAGLPDVGFDIYGGFVRVIVKSWDGLNHRVELGYAELNGIFGLSFQTLDYAGKISAGVCTMTQRTAHYDMSAGKWELLSTILDRQNREIGMLQQVVSGLITKIEGGA